MSISCLRQNCGTVKIIFWHSENIISPQSKYNYTTVKIFSWHSQKKIALCQKFRYSTQEGKQPLYVEEFKI